MEVKQYQRTINTTIQLRPALSKVLDTMRIEKGIAYKRNKIERTY